LVIAPGWPRADNALLRGPGIAVINDGPFEQRHADGILSFGTSQKGIDAAAIGRFGIGQKSVFHLCDAFIFSGTRLGEQDEDAISGVVNPYVNIAGAPAAKDWEGLSGTDLAVLHALAGELGFAQRLILWLPLRREGLQPGPGHAITQNRATPTQLAEELGEPARIAALMPLLRRLEWIEIRYEERVWSARVRPGAMRLQGVGSDGRGPAAPQSVRGALTHTEGDAAFAGLETDLGERALADLKAHPHWPKVISEVGGLHREKACPHGTAILLRDGAGPTGLQVQWAVYLPTSDAEEMRPLPAPVLGNYRLLLHGDFSLDSGRQRIAGLCDEIADLALDAPESEVLKAWNRRLRDAGTLPLIPAVLHAALTDGTLLGAEAAAVVCTLAEMPLFARHRHAICERHSLARVLSLDGTVSWSLISPQARARPLSARVLSSPDRLRELFPDLHDDGRVPIDATSSLLPKEPGWPVNELPGLLRTANPTVLNSRRLAEMLADVVEAAMPNAGRAEREALGAPLADLLRAALASEDNLAPTDILRRIVAFIPDERLLWLPIENARRIARVLACSRARVLATSGARVVALSSELRAGVTEPAQLAEHDMVCFLQALDPLIAAEGVLAEHASRVALRCIWRAARPTDAILGDPHLAALRVARGRSPEARDTRPVTLGELDERRRLGTAFRSGGDVRLLKPLAAALPNNEPLLISLPVTDQSEEARLIPTIDRTACLRVIQRALRFGPGSARAELVELLADSAMGADRDILRKLCAGDADLPGSTRLVVPAEQDASLGKLFARIPPAQQGRVRVLPDDIRLHLSGRALQSLGITPLAADGLHELLGKIDDRVLIAARPTREEAAVILRCIADADLLRRLPIHHWQSARPGLKDGCGPVDAHLFRRSGWPVPPELASLIRFVVPAPDEAAEQRQRILIPEWSPGAQAQMAAGQKEPHEFAMLILDALAALQSGQM
jgi:hypothetical protein